MRASTKQTKNKSKSSKFLESQHTILYSAIVYF